MEDSRKRKREDWSEGSNKVAAAKASHGIVSLVSHKVPVEMVQELHGYFKTWPRAKEEFIFHACGMIMGCQSRPNRKYLCTVLAPACLYQRPDGTGTALNQIKVDVSTSSGKVFKAKLLACDFHYNLAVISFKSTSPLQTVTLKSIDDVISIDPAHRLQSREETTFQLRPHSNLFKIVPGTEITSLWRDHIPPYRLHSGTGYFSSRCSERFNGSEFYKIKTSTYPGCDGGPVLNSLGEIIGIVFNTSTFLPSNIITRWWNHYKSFGDFYRPYLGLGVANLYGADIDFLAQFMTKFPNISTGVIVTKVEDDSPASCSGVRTKDVIVKVDGKPVKSKMQFFESIWEKAGKSVEFNVLRAADGEELNLSLEIEDVHPDKFHPWPHPGWKKVC